MRWAAALVLCACGRVGFDPTAGGDATGATDSADLPDAPALGSFGPPTVLTVLNGGGNDYGPSVTADALELAFNSDRSGQYKLYTASRASSAEMWSAPVLIAASDQAGIEYDAELSSDGTELFFHSEAAPVGIRRMTRASRQDAWTTPMVVSGLAGYEGPALFASDLRMVVSLPGNGGIDEFARATIDASWQLVRSHASLAGHKFATVRGDGLELFAATASGQLVRATRASIDDAFGPVEPVQLGDPWDGYAIYDPELSGDARQMFLSIAAGQGDFDIYVTTR